MKILTQDRDVIMEQPSKIWVTIDGPEERGLVVCSCRRIPTLGIYPDVRRAREVLLELFEYHRNGKNSYIMPEI